MSKSGKGSIFFFISVFRVHSHFTSINLMQKKPSMIIMEINKTDRIANFQCIGWKQGDISKRYCTNWIKLKRRKKRNVRLCMLMSAVLAFSLDFAALFYLLITLRLLFIYQWICNVIKHTKLYIFHSLFDRDERFC